jgi:hypothetical protein
LQFALAARNGVGVQPGDPREQGDPSAALLLGEEADQQPPGALVRSSDETVNPPMLLSNTTMRMLLAAHARTQMDNTPGMLLGHVSVPPWEVCEKAKIILPGETPK